MNRREGGEKEGLRKKQGGGEDVQQEDFVPLGVEGVSLDLGRLFVLIVRDLHKR